MAGTSSGCAKARSIVSRARSMRRFRSSVASDTGPESTSADRNPPGNPEHRAMRLRLTLVPLAIVLVTLIAAPASASNSAPPQTVTAARITVQPNTLRPGTKVHASELGQRVFPNATHGFALADTGNAQYPAATVDGGKTWKTDGPALHLNAAQAPLSVTEVGAAGQRTFFAFGSGQVVDVTSNAGKQWWRAILGDVVLAVVAPGNGELVAFAQDAAGTNGNKALTLVYVSRDGGRHWHLNDNFGAF